MVDAVLEHPFVVVEGEDGTGKTTVSLLVANQIGGAQISTPIEPYKSRRPDAKSPVREKFDFYLESLVYASTLIRELCKEKPVVCDRFVASTYAYHVGMGLKPEEAKEKIAKADILEPSIGILLQGEDDTLTRRLIARGDKPYGEGLRRRIRLAYELFNYMSLDTTYIDQEQVANRIVSVLKEKKLIQKC